MRLSSAVAAFFLSACIHGKDRPLDGGRGNDDAVSFADKDVTILDLREDAADLHIDASAQSVVENITACDVDGDHVQDLVFALPRARGPLATHQPDFGKVVVLAGPDFGLPAGEARPWRLQEAQALIRVHGQAAGDHLGEAIACADLNQDDHDDLVIGAPAADGQRGEVYVVYGRAEAGRVVDLSAAQQPAVRIRGGQPGDAAGSSLHAAPQLLAGAPTSLLIGIPGFGAEHSEMGAVLILDGNALPELLTVDGVAEQHSMLWFGSAAGEALGSAVAAASLSVAALSPAIIAATAAGASRTDCARCGSVRLLSAKRFVPGTIVNVSALDFTRVEVQGEDAAAGFGQALGFADIVGRDGTPDLAIGAPNAEQRGYVYVFDGAALASEDRSNRPIAGSDYRIAFRGRSDSGLGTALSLAGRGAAGGPAKMWIAAPGAASTRGVIYEVEPAAAYPPAALVDLAQASEVRLAIVGARAGDRLGRGLSVARLGAAADGRSDPVASDSRGQVYVFWGAAR